MTASQNVLKNVSESIRACEHRDVRKTEIRFGFETEPSKNLTSVQTVFRQKLHAIRHSNKKRLKVTLLALNVQIKKVSKHDQTEFSI